MSEDFNSNLNPQAISKGSENLDAIQTRSKKKIVSEEQRKLLQLDRVEISREIQVSYHSNLSITYIREELKNYVDMVNQIPGADLVQHLKNNEIRIDSIDTKA